MLISLVEPVRSKSAPTRMGPGAFFSHPARNSDKVAAIDQAAWR